MKKVSIKDIRNKKKGFTLVELIIVIAIIAILAAMAIPKFSAMRMDARVSNDVATAKNLHTIAATMVANGTWKAGDNKLSSDAEVKKRLDGKVATDGLSEGTKATFGIAIGADENITVSCSSKVLYPDPTGAGRSGYLSTCTTGGAGGAASGS